MSVKVNGENAIMPYYYIRNGLLHIKYEVDRCIELAYEEAEKVKERIIACPKNKQAILADAFHYYADVCHKKVESDGIACADHNLQKLRLEHGYKN